MTRVPATPTSDPDGAGHSGFLERIPVVALRVVQFAVDVGAVALICLIPVGLLMLILPRNPDGSVGNLLVAIPAVLLLLGLAVVISWLYFAWLPARGSGRTAGMVLMHLRVVSVDGSHASRSQLSLRWLLLAADGMFFGLVGLAAMLLSPKDQRIGDSLGQTLVERAEH
jgi:uncharacterized RDD family membrane protein YckC